MKTFMFCITVKNCCNVSIYYTNNVYVLNNSKVRFTDQNDTIRKELASEVTIRLNLGLNETAQTIPDEDFIPNNLDSIVGLNVRIRIYKEALEYYQNELVNPSSKYKQKQDNSDSLGICLLLPCILWGLPTYMSPAPDNCTFCYGNTKVAFPEIAKHLPVLNKLSEYLYKLTHPNRNEILTLTRISILQVILADLGL